MRLGFSLLSLVRPVVYRKDFIQEYLLGRAALAGVNPYLPLPELAARLLPGMSEWVFPHPTPHPPVVALLSLPFALLPYEAAALAWFAFEAACLCACAYLLLRWWGRRPMFWKVAGIAVCAFIWDPLLDEFIIGQLNMLLLLLLTGAWLALRKGRPGAAGVLLGAVLSLKLLAWPVVIFVALRREWRAVGSALATGVAAHLGAAAVMGFGAVAGYYRHVGASVAALYRAHDSNFSAWSVGWRLFEGVHSTVLRSVSAPPLVYSPGAARVAAYALSAVVLAVGLFLAHRAKSLDTSFAVLICASIQVGPITWSHYLVLTAIPLAVVVFRVLRRDCPRRLRWAAVAVGLALLLPRLEVLRFVRLFGDHSAVPEQAVRVPFAAGLLTLLPAAAVTGLLWLTWRSDVFSDPATASHAPG